MSFLRFLLIGLFASGTAHCFAQGDSVTLLIGELGQAQKHAAEGEREATVKLVSGVLEKIGPGGNLHDQIPPPTRQAMLLYAAGIYRLAQEFERSDATLDMIAASGEPPRLEAEAELLFQKLCGADGCLDAAIEVLVASVDLSDEWRAVRDLCQAAAIETFIDQFGDEKMDQEQAERLAKSTEQRLVEQDVSPGVASLVRFGLAWRHSKRGNGDLLEERLDQLQSVVGNEKRISPYARALFWNLRARLAFDRHQYFTAMEHCRQFQQAANQLPERFRQSRLAVANDLMARVEIGLGDYEEAQRLLRQTESLNRSNLRQLADWRMNMATALSAGDEVMDARDQYELAAEELRDAPESLQDVVALVENNLAIIHYLLGEFDEADRLINQALGEAAESPVRLGERSVNSGWIALGLGELPRARMMFDRARALFAEHLEADHPRMAEVLGYSARVAWMQGDREQAVKWICEAEAMDFRRLCQDLSLAGSDRDRIALVQQARVHPESIAWPGAVDTFLELAPQLGISQREQYQVVLRWKGLLSRIDSMTSEAVDSESKDEAQIREQLETAYFERPDSSFRIRRWQQELESLESKLREVRRRAANARQIDPEQMQVALHDIVPTLSKGDLVVDVFQIRTFRPPEPNGEIGSAQRYIGFALDAGGSVHRIEMGDAAELDRVVGQWVREISESDQLDVVRFRETSTRVASFVQQPILSLDLKPQRVRIRSDGALHWIPWAALPGADRDGYWIEDVAIETFRRLPLPPKADQPVDKPSLLAVGGVDFGRLEKIYPPLKGTFAEKEATVKKFQKRFPAGSVTELEGKDANKNALTGAMPAANYIHLATHGFYQRRNETQMFEVTGVTTLMQTGVVVAADPNRVGNGSGDQFLTADQIRRLDLSDARLVVLSACESGLGKVQAGQGVQGMLGSFHVAGAPDVIGTLWKVSDKGTTALMERFYEQLWSQNRSPAEALRETQLELIRSVKSPKDLSPESPANPAVWSAFFCSRG